MKLLMSTLIGFTPVAILPASAETHHEVVVDMKKVTDAGIGSSLGTITLREVEAGLEIVPNLSDLPPGSRGFHIHENPECGPKEKDGKMTAAQAAGAHYDPDQSGKHEGPEGHGHRGDLPYLEVATDGKATKSTIAKRLKLSDVMSRSLMIHAGADNYSDAPLPLGGGGARIACGIIQK